MTSSSPKSEFVFNCLKGSVVVVSLKNGTKLDGVFDSLNAGTKSIHMRMVREWKAQQATNTTNDFTEHAFMEIPFSQLASMSAESVAYGELTGAAGFATDSDISGRKSLTERELHRWEADASSPSELGGLEDSATPPGSWDQFQANKELFGVVPSFDENQYTTSIDRHSPAYREKEAKAQRLAEEISRGSTSNLHLAEERGAIFDDSQINEEDRYGAVVREDSKPTAQPASGPKISYRNAAMSTTSSDSSQKPSPVVSPKNEKPQPVAVDKAVSQDQHAKEKTPSQPTAAAAVESKPAASTPKFNPNAAEFVPMFDTPAVVASIPASIAHVPVPAAATTTPPLPKLNPNAAEFNPNAAPFIPSMPPQPPYGYVPPPYGMYAPDAPYYPPSNPYYAPPPAAYGMYPRPHPHGSFNRPHHPHHHPYQQHPNARYQHPHQHHQPTAQHQNDADSSINPSG